MDNCHKGGVLGDIKARPAGNFNEALKLYFKPSHCVNDLGTSSVKNKMIMIALSE